MCRIQGKTDTHTDAHSHHPGQPTGRVPGPRMSGLPTPENTQHSWLGCPGLPHYCTGLPREYPWEDSRAHSQLSLGSHTCRPYPCSAEPAWTQAVFFLVAFEACTFCLQWTPTDLGCVSLVFLQSHWKLQSLFQPTCQLFQCGFTQLIFLASLSPKDGEIS